MESACREMVVKDSLEGIYLFYFCGMMNVSKMTQRVSLLLVALMLVCLAGSAQNKKSALLENDGDHGIGAITLQDGTVLRGPVKFNDNIGAVRYEDRDDPRTLTPSEISGFYFFSEKYSRDRNFVSLGFDDPNSRSRKVYFFEVLKEFKKFAVLTKVDGVQTVVVNNSAYPSTAQNNRVQLTQTETIYFFTDDGKILPYLQIIERETEYSLVDWNSTKNKFINKSLLEKYTGQHYKDLVAFADENKLSFKSKEHLVRILEYYADLIR
jgi:hypothetical protein